MKQIIKKNNSQPSGLILFNKRPGITSFGALGDIKRELGTTKIGHTGTLDKFAQGLMIILAGSALKLSRWFTHLDKQYLGKLYFGIETDTLDPEGNETARANVPLREKVECILPFFTGNIMQKPPEYSAIHIDGKRASDLARNGYEVEIKERPVTVYKLELRSWQPPYAEIFVHCSSGTYIRSLARDIACMAESRAHLCFLERTQIAGFKLEDTKSIESGTESRKNFDKYNLYTPLPVIKQVIGEINLPWFEVSTGEAEKIFNGKPLSDLLDEKPLLNRLEIVAGQERLLCYEAAIFSGETLVAIVKKINNKWKYSCVINSSIANTVNKSPCA
jgi:tRNA pseudouridine55 synthase